MAKIRADLTGVVVIPGDGGEPTILAAGGKIPEGVTVGDHLIDPGDIETPEVPEAGAEGGAEATDSADSTEGEEPQDDDSPEESTEPAKPVARSGRK